MSWFLVIAGVALIALGADIGLLSRYRSQLPQREVDKMVYGDPPPALTDSARSITEGRFFVRAGPPTRLIAVLMAVLGGVLVFFGLGSRS